MMTSFLRPLTLAAMTTLLMTSPLAGTAPGSVSLHTGALQVTARTPATAIHLDALASGAKPAIAYIRGRHVDFRGGAYRLHRPDGTTLRLPRASWFAWAPMGRGAIGTFGTEAGPEVQVVSGTGHVTSSFVTHYGLAVSPDRSIVGWLLGRLNTPHVVEGGGRRTFNLPRIGHGLAIGAISGAKTCKEQAPEGGGCTVFVNKARDLGVWVSTSHGIVTQVGPMGSVSDVDQRGRVIGRTADTGGEPCFGMWKPSGHRLWKTCDSRLTTFSPDGRRVIGTGPVSHRFGNVHTVTMYDDSGHRLASYTAKHGTSIAQVTWEDATHVLATVFEVDPSTTCPDSCPGHWAVVRLGVDGSAELATPVVKGGADLGPYLLPLT
jgi:hypothetical protein